MVEGDGGPCGEAGVKPGDWGDDVGVEIAGLDSGMVGESETGIVRSSSSDGTSVGDLRYWKPAMLGAGNVTK